MGGYSGYFTSQFFHIASQVPYLRLGKMLLTSSVAIADLSRKDMYPGRRGFDKTKIPSIKREKTTNPAVTAVSPLHFSGHSGDIESILREFLNKTHMSGGNVMFKSLGCFR